jgi:uncharacterized protein (DUF1800 family)
MRELSMTSSGATASAIAAQRFGLGEASIDDAVRGDPRGWLVGQIGAADVQRDISDQSLPTAADGLRHYAEFVRQRREAALSAKPGDGDMRSAERQFGEHFRALVQADTRARLRTAALTKRPFTERLALFWANHFTVSMAKPVARGLVGAFEREAIRPHVGGRFEDLLRAAVTHPGMLRYLDNERSAGPHSAVVRRLAQRAPAADNAETAPTARVTGLNENLAREVLELHTLGAAAARTGTYTQADVTAFAALLTGWRVPATAYMAGLREPRPGTSIAAAGVASPTRFEPAWHEPGDKTVLGRRYGEGSDALGQVLHDLAQHPATARFIATKLARHFVDDEPPPALVDRLVQTWRVSDGDLPSLYRTLLEAPEAWSPSAAKLKSPEEWVLCCVRVLGLGRVAFERAPDAGIGVLGQRVQAAPSPAGWPDKAEEWLGPDAVWKRVEWATRLAERVGRQFDARAVAQASVGPLLNAGTARQIERAADAQQALALLLLAPEFQRR